MTHDEFQGLIDPILARFGLEGEVGEEYRKPPLEVLAYHRRAVRLHWLPLLGRAQSVVALVRQPIDLAGTGPTAKSLMDRLAGAAGTRFAPGRAHGFGPIGLTALVTTPEPITPEDEGRLGGSLVASAGSRVVPLGLIRVNLGQEAMAFHLAEGPAGLFPEPVALADALAARFRRFVPLADWD